jgi:hypothetical protein
LPGGKTRKAELEHPLTVDLSLVSLRMIPFALPISCLGELRLEAAGLLCAACGRTCPLWMKSRC